MCVFAHAACIGDAGEHGGIVVAFLFGFAFGQHVCFAVHGVYGALGQRGEQAFEFGFSDGVDVFFGEGAGGGGFGFAVLVFFHGVACDVGDDDAGAVGLRLGFGFLLHRLFFGIGGGGGQKCGGSQDGGGMADGEHWDNLSCVVFGQPLVRQRKF